MEDACSNVQSIEGARKIKGIIVTIQFNRQPGKNGTNKE
jgi:hypothetical protein